MAHSLTVPVLDKSRLQVSGFLLGQMGIKNTALPFLLPSRHAG